MLLLYQSSLKEYQGASKMSLSLVWWLQFYHMLAKDLMNLTLEASNFFTCNISKFRQEHLNFTYIELSLQIETQEK